MSARITISLVEDHDDTRDLLRRRLARQPGFAGLPYQRPHQAPPA